MPIQTAHELFVHELNEMLDCEQKLVEALGELEQNSNRQELKKAFAQHREQTEGHAERLREAIQSIEAEEEEAECKGVQGLIEEVHAFMEEDPSPDVIDTFHVGAAIKTESYEICSYESLVSMAREMGHKKAVQLLQRNLREEEQTLRKMEGFSKKIKPEQSGMEEEEEEAGRRRGRRSRRAA